MLLWIYVLSNEMFTGLFVCVYGSRMQQRTRRKQNSENFTPVKLVFFLLIQKGVWGNISGVIKDFVLSLKDLRSEALPEARGTLELLHAQWSSKADHWIMTNKQWNKDWTYTDVACVLQFLKISV